jgi:hypothetical protein
MLDRDTQAYNRPQRIVDEIKAAAAEGRYLPAVGQPDEAALIYAPEPRSVGAVSLRLETNLDGGTGFQRLGFWGRRISRFNMPPRFTAPGWFVLVRTIRLPSQGQQLTQHDGRRKASYASIRVSIISTSMTAHRTRLWLPTKSIFFVVTFWADASVERPKLVPNCPGPRRTSSAPSSSTVGASSISYLARETIQTRDGLSAQCPRNTLGGRSRGPWPRRDF